MRIGIGTYALAWSIGVPGFEPEDPMDIYGFLEFVHSKGIKLVQIADNLPLHVYSNKELEKIRTLANQFNIEIEVGTRGLLKENVMRYLEIASFFNSPILRIVIDNAEFKPKITEIVRIIQDLVPDLKEKNIKLAIENHDRFKASQFCEIVESVNSDYVGICLDSVNSIGADEGFQIVFDLLARYTINFHLKDYMIRRKPHMMGFDITGTPAGKGMMPLKSVLATLSEMGKTDSMILELWPEPENSLKKTIEKERRWIDESLEYLNNLTI